MSPRSEIQPVAALGKRSRSLLSRLKATRRPVVITVDGEAEGVLLDLASYEEMRDAMGLLKLISVGEQDIQAGRLTDLADAFEEIRRAIPTGRARKR